MIRVTIVSPNPALRIGLRELLGGQSDIEVVSEAVSLEYLDNETEVLLLASVSPLNGGGVPSAIVAELDFEGKAILLLTDDPEDVQALLHSSARAWGVLSLNATEDELLAGVRAVGEGLWVGAPGLMSDVMRGARRVRLTSGDSLVEPLTAREKEVLQWMAEGMANKQIALSLGISEHTVKFHLSSLYAKLNVSSRTEAVKAGLGLGLISI